MHGANADSAARLLMYELDIVLAMQKDRACQL
jgi:hypothetical protein